MITVLQIFNTETWNKWRVGKHSHLHVSTYQWRTVKMNIRTMSIIIKIFHLYYPAQILLICFITYVFLFRCCCVLLVFFAFFFGGGGGWKWVYSVSNVKVEEHLYEGTPCPGPYFISSLSSPSHTLQNYKKSDCT